MSISPVIQVCLAGLAVAGFVAVVMPGGSLRVPAVHAQSSTWEVIAQPENIAGVAISVIRHTVTHHCLVVVQSGSALALHQDAGLGGLCDTPEEYEERKSRWQNLVVDDIPASFRMFDERVQSSAQPSAGQTTKQPGVPR